MAQEFIELHANDDVLIALRDVAKDTELLGGIIVSDDILRGHKVARKEVAEQVEAGKGLVFMDAPSLDNVSATAQVAGGAHVMVFTTDRGSAFGCKPTPSIKLAGSTSLFERMPDDMDINAGTILDGEETVEQVGERIFERIIEVASGDQSCIEKMGYDGEEFAPWDMGVIL